MPMKCKERGCDKSACYRYNEIDEDGNVIYDINKLRFFSCAEHKKGGMAPIRGLYRGTMCITCQVSRACYAMPNETPLFCSICKLAGMINISNNRNSCRHEENGVRCGKWPSYGIEKATKCAKHKEDGMTKLR